MKKAYYNRNKTFNYLGLDLFKWHHWKLSDQWMKCATKYIMCPDCGINRKLKGYQHCPLCIMKRYLKIEGINQEVYDEQLEGLKEMKQRKP